MNSPLSAAAAWLEVLIFIDSLKGNECAVTIPAGSTDGGCQDDFCLRHSDTLKISSFCADQGYESGRQTSIRVL